MKVRIANPEELKARGYSARLLDDGIAYIRTLLDGRQFGIRLSTIESLYGQIWNWNEFEYHRDQQPVARQFSAVLSGKWILEDMITEIESEAVVVTPHACHCPTRALMMHGCKCGGI